MLFSALDKLDRQIATWMRKNGITLLRISLGLIFLWFGVLKFFSGASPAEKLAVDTITLLTFGLLSSANILLLLATWETLIGLGLLLNVALRTVLFLLFVQMLGTLTPLFLFPHVTFARIPLVPTLEGQYIIKNLVLISAGIVIGSTVRNKS